MRILIQIFILATHPSPSLTFLLLWILPLLPASAGGQGGQAVGRMPGQADDSMLSGADFITWRRARLPWLGPELSIVLVKVLHQFLAIQERLARTNQLSASSSKMYLECWGGEGEGWETVLLWARVDLDSHTRGILIAPEQTKGEKN